MLRWIERLMARFHPPADPRTPLEIVLDRIGRTEAEIAELTATLATLRHAITRELDVFFPAWFVAASARQATRESGVTVQLGSRTAALKAEIGALAANSSQLVRRELGPDEIWVPTEGSGWHLDRSRAGDVHPLVGPAIARVADELWTLMERAGYEKRNRWRTEFNFSVDLPASTRQLFTDYAWAESGLFRARRMLRDFLHEKEVLDAGRLWSGN